MLVVHFLNVGHGDCTVIAHPSGRLTMIDCNASVDYDSESQREFVEERARRLSANPLASAAIGGGIAGFSPFGLDTRAPGGAISDQLGYLSALDEARRELTDPIEFMLRRYPGRRLWRYVQSHPDLDHMRGIKRLSEAVGFDNFWDTAHTKPAPNFQSDDDEADWTFYQRLRSGGGQSLRFHRGDERFAFARDEGGLPGGDQIEVLSPTPALVQACNDRTESNDLSYVLRVRHAGRGVLLPGDAESVAWAVMRLHYASSLRSDVLKAAHHGRDSGYDLEALKLIAPTAVIVSVGRKPPTDASNKYHAQCGWVMSTRYYGDIELQIHDDGTLHWFVQRNAGKP